MIHAYDELYLGNARKVLAKMLDLAVFRYGVDLSTIYDLFKVSSVARRFENGDCSILAGHSGAELLEMVLEESGFRSSEMRQKAQETGRGNLHCERGRSREYWVGWALAYYQWYSGLRFEQIDSSVRIEEIKEMYSPFHEMDILSFCDEMTRRIYAKRSAETRLRYYRNRLGISQSQLAEAAEIPVRTIQQYEQRQKDINHARSANILRLSKALGCMPEDLMEVDSF